jgi:hypothetical protein
MNNQTKITVYVSNGKAVGLRMNFNEPNQVRPIGLMYSPFIDTTDLERSFPDKVKRLIRQLKAKIYHETKDPI